MGKCPKNPDGIHRITHLPPYDEESLEEWKKLSYTEKTEAQFCIDCGEAIW